jgi:hypothetical protein
MMNLLGAGNPYIRRYAEGGEVAPAQPESLTYRAFKTYSAEELAKLQNDYRAREQEYQQQLAQAEELAQQDARGYFDRQLAATTNQILQQNQPEIDLYRSTINQIQAFRDGRTNRINIISPHGGREIWERENFGPGSEWVVDQALEFFNRDINNLSSPDVLRKQALQRLVDQSPSYSPYGFTSMVFTLTGQPTATEDAYKQVEQVLRDELFQVAYPQAEAKYVQPLTNQFSAVQGIYNRDLESAYQRYERQAEGAVDKWYEYLDSRKADVDKQVEDVYRREGYYSPEATALLKAYEAEKAYLRGPEFQFRPTDFDRSREVFYENFGKLYQPTPFPSLVPSEPAPTPSTPAPQPTQPTTPGVIPPTSVPLPGIPTQPSTPTGIPTPPSVPSGNLTPQPLPGITAPPSIGGIPQPGIGYQPSSYQSMFPGYQSPTFQATQPTQQQQQQQQQPQQQIQYGPIGQGAVGQASLLSTLLSQQQDPTKVSLLGFDNPYLMKPFG